MSELQVSVRTWRWRLLTVVPIVALLIAAGRAASEQTAGAGKGTRPVTLEIVEGSPVKRIVLSPQAAKRLDVQLGAIAEQAVARTQVVGAILVDPSAASPASQADAPAAASSARATGLLARLALSPPEWERLVKDKPARIVPLQTRPGLPKDVLAKPSGQPPIEVGKSGMLSVFYVVPREASGLAIGDRVRAELQFEGSAEARKVVPYSAVYYDEKGAAWVYVNTAPLTFIRQPVVVERVAGGLAVLGSGPDVGTKVVTVGVSLLYGAEIFGK